MAQSLNLISKCHNSKVILRTKHVENGITLPNTHSPLKALLTCGLWLSLAFVLHCDKLLARDFHMMQYTRSHSTSKSTKFIRKQPQSIAQMVLVFLHKGQLLCPLKYFF